MNTYQKALAIFKYLTSINSFSTGDFTFKNTILKYRDEHIGDLLSVSGCLSSSVIASHSGTIIIQCVSAKSYVLIDGQRFSTELSEEELFQYSLQYPVLENLINAIGDRILCIKTDFVDPLYEIIK